jgi:hypothetical protein
MFSSVFCTPYPVAFSFGIGKTVLLLLPAG